MSGVGISNPGRVIFSDEKITKLAPAQFYERIARWVLPHMQGRPLTLVRCPDGARARAGAPISTPLRWDELKPDVTPDTWTVLTIERRLALQRKDPWADYWTCRQRLSRAAAGEFK